MTYERYDRSRNSVHLEDGNGDSLEIEYDRLGQVKALVDGGGNVYSIERNRNGTLKRSVFPDNSEENYTYRPNGLNVNTRAGVTKQFNYDNDGRVVWKDSGSDDVTTYQYDNNGNMIAASILVKSEKCHFHTTMTRSFSRCNTQVTFPLIINLLIKV